MRIKPNMRLRSIFFTAGIIACASVALPASDAAACANVTSAELDANVKKVKTAEAALEKGDFTTAKKSVREVQSFFQFPEGTMIDGKREAWPQLQPLLRRALRVELLATSRDPKSKDKDRAETVTKLEQTFFVKDGPKPEPSLLADHAEMLSRIPSRSGTALMVLRTLRDKDLIGSAHAYAALARLEAAAGQPDAEKDARERCRKAATNAAVCDR